MYPARPQPPVVDLTQPEQEDDDSDGDDAPVRPEDPPETDDLPDLDFNANVSVPTGNQEVSTGAASSAATSQVPLTSPPLSTMPA
eukprot:10417327-Prorocentrum_lima.AAC.1